MSTATLCLTGDATALVADLEMLSDAAALSPEVRQRALDLFEGSAELIRLDVDAAAAGGADEVRVRFQAADGLAELVAAVRAGQFDAVGVDVDGHGALAVVARQGDVACGAAPVAKGA